VTPRTGRGRHRVRTLAAGLALAAHALGCSRGEAPASGAADEAARAAAAAAVDAAHESGPATAADGAGAFVATLLRAAGNDDFVFGGTVSPYVWVTRARITACDFSAAIDDPPQPEGRWSFRAEWAPLAPEQGCDAIERWNEAALCSIEGSGRSCTARGVPIDLRGPACLRGRAVIEPGENRGRHPGRGSGGTASFHCRDASGEGPSHFQGTGQTEPKEGVLHAGAVVRAADQDRAHWIHTGVPLARCSGVFVLPAPPADGERWQVHLAASAAPLEAGSSCDDLRHETTDVLCTIGPGQRSCDFAGASVAVPTGGCLQLRVRCSGGDCRPGAVQPQYGLDCSASPSGRLDGGGPRYDSAGSGAFDAAHSFGPGPWGIGDANAASLAFGQAYWIAPPSGLARCSGALTFQQPLAGSGRYEVGLRVATAPLAPGQGCLDVSYAERGPFCTIAAGAKSCWFPLRDAAVPPGACFALHVRASGGEPLAGLKNEFNWQASCTAD